MGKAELKRGDAEKCTDAPRRRLSTVALPSLRNEDLWNCSNLLAILPCDKSIWHREVRIELSQ